MADYTTGGFSQTPPARTPERVLGERDIQYGQPGIDSGFRYRDVLADLAFPAPQIAARVESGIRGTPNRIVEDRFNHLVALKESWGERLSEDDRAELYDRLYRENVQNVAEGLPVVPALMSSFVYGKMGDLVSPRGTPPPSAFGRVLTKAELKQLSRGIKGHPAIGLAALIGGAGIGPAASALGASYPVSGGIITPGGSTGQSQWASREAIDRADEKAMELEKSLALKRELEMALAEAYGDGR